MENSVLQREKGTYIYVDRQIVRDGYSDSL